GAVRRSASRGEALVRLGGAAGRRTRLRLRLRGEAGEAVPVAEAAHRPRSGEQARGLRLVAGSGGERRVEGPPEGRRRAGRRAGLGVFGELPAGSEEVRARVYRTRAVGPHRRPVRGVYGGAVERPRAAVHVPGDEEGQEGVQLRGEGAPAPCGERE